MDVREFVSIRFEMVVGHPAKDEADIPKEGPQFVSEMIKTGLSDDNQPRFTVLRIANRDRDSRHEMAA
jgi:hypothetical protein